MRFIIATTFLTILSAGQAEAESFKPDGAAITRIADRFRSVLDQSGINGVGRDVMQCYEDNLDNAVKLKECVVYDSAALIVDRTMTQIFTANGVNVMPVALYTNRAFDARQNTYGKIAFRGDLGSRKLVGPVAQKVVEKVLPR